MKLHVDLETLQLIEGPGFRNPVNVLRFKRGDGARLEVIFLRGGATPKTIGDPASLEMHFGIKPRNRFDVGYLVHTADWTLPTEQDDIPVYQCSPSFNTVELDAVLGVGSPAGAELSEVTLMGEITWRQGQGEPTSTRTFLVIVENDVNRGTEGVPTNADPPYPAPSAIELISRKGAAFGYASLDASGKVPLSQLPHGSPPSHGNSPSHGGSVDHVQVDPNGVTIGISAVGSNGTTVVGNYSSADLHGTSCGANATAMFEAVGLGVNSYAGSSGVAVGAFATVGHGHGIAIGSRAQAGNASAIAIGKSAVAGDGTWHGIGRIEIASGGPAGPRIAGLTLPGGEPMMAFSAPYLHGWGDLWDAGAPSFNFPPGAIPHGMFTITFVDGGIAIYANRQGTVRKAIIPFES